MAIDDFTSFLGKRVRLTFNYPTDEIPPYLANGVIVGFVKYAECYEHTPTNEVFFLEDGEDEPDFVHFDVLELIG